jgi:spermidine synthase
MQPVIFWHQQGILPVGDQLHTHPKSELVHADFFAVATDEHRGFLNEQPVHAVLLDIDHSPSHWLNEQNQNFYTAQSLRKVAAKIHSGGVFALWSNEHPDREFTRVLESVFSCVEAHIVRFDNPYSGGESINTVYTAVVR